jgi:hypothetical protein
MPSSRHAYHSCYISAPIGLSLGTLPELLAARNIAWEWASNTDLAEQNSRDQIAAADFALIVLNGTRADYRGAFDAGIAAGLDKPVFLLQSKVRPLPIDLRLFTLAKVKLSDRNALEFHLDLFLATPRELVRVSTASKPATGISRPPSGSILLKPPFESFLERRVFEAIVAAGGNAIVEAATSPQARYRPDLLASFSEVEPELLDLVAIEVKHRVAPGDASKVDDRLLGFMTSSRVKIGFVVTDEAPPHREQQLSPNILWVSIGLFETLAKSGRLGAYVRDWMRR